MGVIVYFTSFFKKKRKKKKKKRMNASVLKQDPNTKRFKRTLMYYDTDKI